MTSVCQICAWKCNERQVSRASGPGEGRLVFRDPRGDVYNLRPPAGPAPSAGGLLQADFRKPSFRDCLISVKCLSLLGGHGRENLQVPACEQIFPVGHKSQKQVLTDQAAGAIDRRPGREKAPLRNWLWVMTNGKDVSECAGAAESQAV